MKYVSSFFLTIGVYALTFVVGCSYGGKALVEKTINNPVFINPVLTVSEYMASTVDKLADELSMAWNMKVAVKQIYGNQIREVDSCNSILLAHNDGFEPIDPSYYAPYQSVLMQCRAITIAVEMAPSNISYLNNYLDQTTIGELPAAMAFVPSKNQQLSIEANTSPMTLDDATPIIELSQVNDYEVELHIEGGSQSMVVLAKGDENGDGIEDVLIQVTNATEGGSYRATHLFLLSKNERNGVWLLLSAY